MLIDTHCHINMMVKQEFDIPLAMEQIADARLIIDEAIRHDITTIINVGTSVVESQNCIALATHYEPVFATIGIHPNDCTESWTLDVKNLKKLLENKTQNKIVGIGEIGIDRHYPDHHLARQQDAFRAQIELALEHDLAVVVHTRDAADETLRILEEYRHDIERGIIHCFSEDLQFAQQVIAWKYAIGIGGTITYPKNNELRRVVTMVDLEQIVLETDSPFLPPQSMRGKQNHPRYIALIAQYIAELRNISVETVAAKTAQKSAAIFELNH
jgi:TatD DNase family protein